MASATVAGTVESAALIGSLTSPTSCHPWDALYQFVAGLDDTPDTTSNTCSHKKRKLNNSCAIPSSPFESRDYATIAHVVTHLSAPQAFEAPSWQSAHRPIEVSFESIEPTAEREFRLVLRNSNSPASRIDLTIQSRDLEAGLPHLKCALKFPKTRNDKSFSRQLGAIVTRCILHPPTQEEGMFRLETSLLWELGVSVVGKVGPKTRLGRLELDILGKYFPDSNQEAESPWSVQDFYENVHIPPTDVEVPQQIGNCFVDTTLYPFQKRAVQWLLTREGVSFSQSGGAPTAIKPYSETSRLASFKPIKDAHGKEFYVSHLHGLVVSDTKALFDAQNSLKGGILAEEMGLGKTVELLALVCHNTRHDMTHGKIHDTYTHSLVTPSTATLIITPPSILEQWKSEVAVHAPHLKVFHYEGIGRLNREDTKVEKLLEYDIVLTTYQVLSREIHHARPPPERSLRHPKIHENRKSPLVQISWWRVCLDEAQMVESGVSQAAVVARLIPRVNAWAVSGTPLRKDVQDLRGLLTFLRYEPYADSKALWERLDKATFKDIFSQIAMRHTKSRIREELRIPPQKRVVITVPFTAIEEQNYSELIRQMCDACGVSVEGVPAIDDQSLDEPAVVEKMREWLMRLRQTCLHAHVGSKNKKALGSKAPIRTVDQVLETMIDQNDNALKAAARELISTMLLMGHIQANAENHLDRSIQGKTVYEKALEETSAWVRRGREDLEEEKLRLGLGFVEEKANPLQLDEDDVEEEDVGNSKLGRIPALRKSLRLFLEQEHVCKFSIATMYHQIKINEAVAEMHHISPEEAGRKEDVFYEQAKAIRMEILQASQKKAQQHITKLSVREQFITLPRIGYTPKEGGIEIETLLETMDDVVDVLNKQATLLEELRAKALKILLLPLIDQEADKDTTGDEYEDSTKVQDELYVYIMALRTAIADRNAILNGQQDLLVNHEFEAAVSQALGGNGHAPELLLKISEERKLNSASHQASLKEVISAIRSLVSNLQWKAESGDGRAELEQAIAQKQLTRAQNAAASQTKASTQLEKELEQFRGAMNQRLEFYRQLQHISDQVVPYKENLDATFDQAAHEKQVKLEKRQRTEIAKLETKQRYLVNLRREHKSDKVRECIICQDTFEIGVMTVCGHSFCKECIMVWWKSHKRCPTCKQEIRGKDLLDISYKPLDIKAREEIHDDGSPSQPSSPSSMSIYSDISDSTMKQIKSIELDGFSYGTKIDMIARHLLWIRHNDPGSKSIIFSQFGDFLDVLKEALGTWKIGCSSIHNKKGIESFKNDPTIECFLLDAKSDSSGINLVNATYVFLAEPMINVALELQAIARVHRIGQQRPTTVFMYLVSDTVEEVVYDISVARRLEHMGQNKNPSSQPLGASTPALQEMALDAANTLEVQQAPLKQLLRKKGDGEIVQSDDVWKCLFSKPRKQRVDLDREVSRYLRVEAASERMAGEGAREGCSG